LAWLAMEAQEDVTTTRFTVPAAQHRAPTQQPHSSHTAATPRDTTPDTQPHTKAAPCAHVHPCTALLHVNRPVLRARGPPPTHTHTRRMHGSARGRPGKHTPFSADCRTVTVPLTAGSRSSFTGSAWRGQGVGREGECGGRISVTKKQAPGRRLGTRPCQAREHRRASRRRKTMRGPQARGTGLQTRAAQGANAEGTCTARRGTYR
jgi:hypothetical protein